LVCFMGSEAYARVTARERRRGHFYALLMPAALK
jgi:hypothetical protein